jgi:ribosomal protein S18 acetylase RimI-like enzyme
MTELTFRPARPADAARLEMIRARAFAPVFASFRALLGDAIYERAQRPGDEAQRELLASLIAGCPGWALWVAGTAGSAQLVGFVAVRLDEQTGVGEIGLNAVDPAFAGRGVGTAMYDYALERMREAGMAVAVVATGGDSSHAPARRAYRKAGFDHAIPSLWMCRSLGPPASGSGSH